MEDNKKITKGTLIWSIISGILLVLIGFVGLFISPLKTAYNVTWAFGFISVFTGAYGMAASFTLKKQGVDMWWMMLIQGIAGFIIGIYLMTSPIITEVLIIKFSGWYIIGFGIARLISSRESWGIVLLKIFFGVSLIVYPGFFFIWGFILLFSLFIMNGIYTVYTSLVKLKSENY